MSFEQLHQEAERWHAQAEDDLKGGKVLAEAGHHALASFHAQQAAEKALKGLWRSLDHDPRGHSCVRLVEELPSDIGLPASDLLPLAAALDKLYIPTRYPDALPGLTPAEAYTAEEAERALTQARRVLDIVQEYRGQTR